MKPSFEFRLTVEGADAFQWKVLDCPTGKVLDSGSTSTLEGALDEGKWCLDRAMESVVREVMSS
jgi:hypothetical protein